MKKENFRGNLHNNYRENFTESQEKTQKEQLIDAFAQFLGKYDWTLYWTQTFRDEYKENQCLRAFKRTIDSIERRFGVTIGYYLAIEHHKLRVAYHFHSLLCFTPLGLFREDEINFFKSKEFRNMLWEELFERYGRNTVSAYDPKKGARFYLTKYIFKEDWGLAYWDIGGYLREIKKNS